MSSRKNTISPSTPAPAAYLSLLVCAGLFIAFGWQAISLLTDVYKGSEDYSHGFVVPLVSLYAAYEIRKKYPHETYTANWLGLPIALLGSLIVILGIWYRYALLPGGLGVQSITGTGLFILLIGLSCSLGGIQIIKRYLFPLGYMAFAVPWPESLTNKITVPLRSIVTDVSVDIIRQCGIAVFQEGNVIHLATATLGVADACSGIRSLWIMLATAVAFGYFLRCGLVRSLILFILAFPLSVLFNIIRVVATGMLVAWNGPQWSTGTKHEMTGAVVFLLGVITLVAIGWVLALGRHSVTAAGSVDTPAAPIKVGTSSDGRTARYLLVSLLALLLILGSITQSIIKRHYVQTMPVATRKPFTAFPKNIGEFHEKQFWF